MGLRKLTETERHTQKETRTDATISAIAENQKSTRRKGRTASQSVEHETLNLRVVGSSPTLGAKCRHGFENRERTASTLLATPHNKGLVQIVRELFLLLRFSRRWRTHGYQTTNTDNERRTTDTETRLDNRIY